MPETPTALPLTLPATLTVAAVESFNLPENADLVAVAVELSTAPVGSAAVFDVLDGGTSLFATALGVVRVGETAQGNDSGTPLSTTSTTVVIDPSGSELAIKNGLVITIDSEDMLVTASGGSYETEQGAPEYQVTVTRAVNGTTATTHNVGASVYPAKPKVAAGSTASAGVYAPAGTVLPSISYGSNLSLTCTQIGSTTAGGGGTATLEIAER